MGIFSKTKLSKYAEEDSETVDYIVTKYIGIQGA
jgi:hypothetical protein